MKVNKSPLDLSLYESYGIDQSYSAFVIEILDVVLAETDNIEYEYISQGHKIFSSQINQSNKGLFNLILIVATSNFIFNK